MAENYPALSLSGVKIGKREIYRWTGWIQPIRSQKEIAFIVWDLYKNRRVLISVDGEVSHCPKCNAHDIWDHFSSPFFRKPLRNINRDFRVSMQYDGTARHPRAYLLEPKITEFTSKHAFYPNGICAYAPWESPWHYKSDSVVDFADHVMIWLIKWNMWIQTKVWLGSEMQHDSLFKFAQIHGTMQCWCGSSRSYSKCHQQKDWIDICEKRLKKSTVRFKKKQIRTPTLDNFLLANPKSN